MWLHLYKFIRKTVEVLGILFFLPLLLLLFFLITIAIKWDDKGQILFVQDRIGKDGKLFKMYKFRTMAEAPERAGSFRLTLHKDSRITTVGKYLRALRVDELPQILNLLKGDMNFIGPRPVPSSLYQDYLREIPRYDDRHEIIPGITGYAQIKLGYTATLIGEREKLQYDLKYIGNQGPVMDLKILIFTFLRRYSSEAKVAQGKTAGLVEKATM